MSKRKIDDVADSDVTETDVAETEDAKRQRRRTRSSSEPALQNETEEPEKREVLKRLFGRYCTVNTQENRREEDSDDNDDYNDVLDENEDPLLDIVPSNMDPEQLGFLVCAQETLRFLHGRGFTAENPMFMRLRSRLLQGIADIAAA